MYAHFIQQIRAVRHIFGRRTGSQQKYDSSKYRVAETFIHTESLIAHKQLQIYLYFFVPEIKNAGRVQSF